MGREDSEFVRRDSFGNSVEKEGRLRVGFGASGGRPYRSFIALYAHLQVSADCDPEQMDCVRPAKRREFKSFV